MKRIVVVLIHCGYWLIYLLLFSLLLAILAAQVSGRPPGFQVPLALLVPCVLPNLVSFYAFYFLLAPRFLVRKRIVALITLAAAVCLISAVTGALLSVIFFGFGQPIFSDAREFVSLTASLWAICAVHGAAALVVRGFVAWYDEMKLREELTRRNFETELALVRSQIDPHFLFNTINNIDVLIAKDPERASKYLNKLSGILRYLVYETKAERIPLAMEIDYIGKYVELQKIRTTNPGYVNFEATGYANDLRIAPMILFPFIENAFKHAEGRKNSNSILIKVSAEKKTVLFECVNSYQVSPDRTREIGGLGDELIRRRLALIYPEKHSLEAADDGTTYSVKLTLHED